MSQDADNFQLHANCKPIKFITYKTLLTGTTLILDSVFAAVIVSSTIRRSLKSFRMSSVSIMSVPSTDVLQANIRMAHCLALQHDLNSISTQDFVNGKCPSFMPNVCFEPNTIWDENQSV